MGMRINGNATDGSVNAAALGLLRLRFLRFAFHAFLDAHIPEFAGFEDFAAFQALEELRIFFPAYYLYARVFAGALAGVLRLGERL